MPAWRFLFQGILAINATASFDHPTRSWLSLASLAVSIILRDKPAATQSRAQPNSQIVQLGTFIHIIFCQTLCFVCMFYRLSHLFYTINERKPGKVHHLIWRILIARVFDMLYHDRNLFICKFIDVVHDYYGLSVLITADMIVAEFAQINYVRFHRAVHNFFRFLYV